MSIESKINAMASRLREAAARCAEDCRDDIRREIGTQYPPASDPYTPPHRRTGKLQREVTTTPRESNRDRSSTSVDSPTSYGEHLEHGTERMAARPFKRPAREKWGAEWRKRAKQAIRAAK